jgi:hypothetical protein
MKNYKTLIAIRGFHTGGEIPDGAVISLSAKSAAELQGLVEETGEEATFSLDVDAAAEPIIGIGPDDKEGLVKALSGMGAIVILPHDDGSLDLRDLPASALLAGVLAKIGTGEITQGDISLIVTDGWALTDLAYRLGNGLSPDLVSSLLPPPPKQPEEDAASEGEKTGADEAPVAKKPAKKTTPQE